MRMFRSVRLILLALLIALIPASSYAGVFISVGFAPPVLPVYEQPPCPEPGLMWTPGYWAYGPDGYYWVPATWVPAPYVGALWTPGYWGWGGGLYIWNPGYWGPHVGYYGGVNYGFGYMGIGFVGGVWHGGVFAYNRAVVNVNTTVIHNVYEDRTVIESHTVAVNSHVAFSGGPGGINHQPTPQENSYSHEQHVSATSYQTQHETAARTNVNSYASHNGGHPTNAAMERPMGGRTKGNVTVSPQNGPNKTPRGNYSGSQTTGAGAGKTYNSSHSNTSNYTSTAPRQGNNQSHPAPAPQSHPAPASHPAPTSHPAPKPEGHEHDK